MSNKQEIEITIDCFITQEAGPNCHMPLEPVRFKRHEHGAVTIADKEGKEINIDKETLIKILNFLNE